MQNLQNTIDLLKGMKKATESAYGYYKSRKLTMMIRPGAPREIVKTVREQIAEDGKSGIKAAALAGLKIGVGAANAVAGSILNAIASLYSLVTSIFNRLREKKRLKALFAESESKRLSGLHKRPAEFKAWFIDHLNELPIIASYCLCMPMTGSYFGFLAAVSDDGTAFSQDQLKKSYGIFNDLKDKAGSFIQKYEIRLHSQDKLVQHSLAIAQNPSGWRVATKEGVTSRVWKTLTGMVEKAGA